jgi:hypothetical protein
MTYKPKPWQCLHASCSDEDVYEIIGPGKDANGRSTLDVRVIDLNAMLNGRRAARSGPLDRRG